MCISLSLYIYRTACFFRCFQGLFPLIRLQREKPLAPAEKTLFWSRGVFSADEGFFRCLPRGVFSADGRGFSRCFD